MVWCMLEAAHRQRSWNRNNEADFLAKLKEAGMAVVEHPDLASFRARVSHIRELDLFKDPKVRDMLQKFLQAAQP